MTAGQEIAKTYTAPEDLTEGFFQKTLYDNAAMDEDEVTVKQGEMVSAFQADTEL